MDKVITIIIPLRLSEFVFEGEERLKRIINNIPSDLFDVLIVDYGTVAPYKEKLQKFNSFQHVTVHSVSLESDAPFSIGEARDIGSQYARTPIILFHDVDFICTSNMYKKINVEVEARKMIEEHTNDFFCVPVAFLNEDESNTFVKDYAYMSNALFDNEMQQKLLTKSKSICDFIVYGSSAIVVNRYHYLRLGGHSRDFYGHGAEDYDVLHRLAKSRKKAPRPYDYYKDTKSNLILEYKGFRAFFALFGIDVFQKGIFMAHLWHPTRTLPDYFQAKRNFSILEEKMKANDRVNTQPFVLEDKTSNEKTLILSKQGTFFSESIRDALPAMGELVFIDEGFFKDAEALLSYFSLNKISKIGFKNPYGNTHRLKLYQTVKENNVPYWVMDRGALPNSWFFDTKGFNAESSSYSKKTWAVELTDEQKDLVSLYIEDVCKSDRTLEKNGQRKGAEAFRVSLGVKNKKVLFIPFQRPSDSVCKYFSGSVKSATGFNDFVSEFVEQIDKNEWLILGKKHPLEKDNPKINGIKFVSSETHIHDLLEISDKVCLLNSGVGLLAALFNKPVLYAGEAFYGHEGINYKVNSVDDAVKLLNSNLVVDRKLVHQFIYHLRTNIYSFAETIYADSVGDNSERLSLAQKINFEEIRGLTEEPIILRRNLDAVDLDEIMCNSFGGKERMKLNEVLDDNNHLGVKHYLGLKLFMIFATPFTSKKKLMKLKRNPYAFFRDANGPMTKAFGKFIGIIN